MAELTLADLVAWEPRLRVAADNGFGEGAYRSSAPLDRWAERELTWVVTARASAPMLPLLRGGELVILPARVLADSGASLPLLLRELSTHDVTGVVLDAPSPPSSPIPTLVIEALTPDFENELNRLLTQQRGEIYRTGTELGRRLATLTTAGGDLADVLDAAESYLGVGAGVVDGRGSVVAASRPEAVPVASGGSPMGLVGVHGWWGDHLAISLGGGETLWLGPVGRDRRAHVRVAGERLAVAAEATLTRAALARPRGAARASALAALLTGADSDAPRAAAALGLPAEGRYRVALAAPGTEAAMLQRFLAPMGMVHDAGEIDGATAAVVELRGEANRPKLSQPMRSRNGVGVQRGWVAVSGVAAGGSILPATAREGRFVAALLAAGAVVGPVSRFDDLDDLGPYRLLYRLWGTPDLAAFVGEALGDLISGDRRGTLRETLLAYLSAGGSHVEAAARLGIHRNTLSYRLKQIASLTGHEPADPNTRLVLHLALLAASLPPAPVGVA